MNTLYDDANGMHYHQCYNCGSVWQHPEDGGTDECNMRVHGRKNAHACPKCGRLEHYKMPLVVVTRVDYPWNKQSIWQRVRRWFRKGNYNGTA